MAKIALSHSTKLSNSMRSIKNVLDKVVKVVKRQFKYNDIKPNQLTPGVLRGDAVQIYPVLKLAVKEFERHKRHVHIGLIERSIEKRKRKDLEDLYKDTYYEFKRLRNYFKYIQNNNGKMPQKSILGILTRKNTLAEYNDYPMIKMVEGWKNNISQEFFKYTGY